MKRGTIGVTMLIMALSANAQASNVADPTVAERKRSIAAGICVARENQEVTSRMLHRGSSTGLQDRFMELIEKCTIAGKNIFPNIVMGAAAEELVARKSVDIEQAFASQALKKRMPRDTTEDSYFCAIDKYPSSLARMLRTGFGSAEELGAVEEFRVALVACGGVRAEGVAVAQIRASAARAAFVMMGEPDG